jgi:Domain of unknown function (DUF4270)
MKPNILMPIMIFMTRYCNTSRHNRRFVSVPQQFISFFQLALFTILAVFVSSCEKQVLKNGSDILPLSDFVSIKSIDTLSVFSYTMYDDSVRTDLPSTSYLGRVYDPYFGTTDAEFVTQIRLNTKWDGLPFTVDSMKLVLHLLTTKGGASDVIHTFGFSEISDQIYVNSLYYSNTKVNTTGFNVTGIKLPALRTDTINDLELTLPGNGIALGNYLIRDTAKLFYNNNIPDFRAYFKGLHFQMDPSSDPMLVSLSFVYNTTTQTYYNYFELFGHDDAGTAKQYNFIIDAKNKNASFNRFLHDYTTATLGDKMAHKNTTYLDTLSYLQSLNGVYTKVALPGLEKIKNDASFGKIAINKARLVVPVKFNKTATDQYISATLPPILGLRFKTKSGTRYIVPDWNIEPTYHTFFDGKLDSTALVYNFNIPAFVQLYLENKSDTIKPELEIYQGTGIRNAILKANANKTPVKFEFTYTKF